MNKDILRLAVPSIVSNITVPLLSLADIAIVGHMAGATHLAAISVGAMTFNVMYWVLGFLRMSTSGLTAQAFGARDEVAAGRLFWQSLSTGLALGLLILAAFSPLRSASLLLMRVGEASRPLVETYFNVCVVGAPAVLGSFALNGFLIGMQNTRIPMVVAVVQNVCNILLSLVFVFVLKMGIAGVALGTAMSQWLAFISLFVAARRCYPNHTRLSVSFLRGDGRQSWVDFLTTSRDIFLRTLCLVAVNMFFTSAGSAQGELVLAVNTLVMTLFTLFSYIMDGFAYAAEALAGRFCGEGDSRGLALLHRRLSLWGAGAAAAFTIAYYVGGDALMSLLTDDTTVVSAAAEYTVFALLIPVSGVMAFVYDGIFIGMTRTKEMLVSTFVGAAVFFALYFLLFSRYGNHALWTALLSYLFLRGVVLAVLWRVPRQ